GVMVAADRGGAAVLGLIPLAAVGGWLRLEMVYAVALVTGVLDTIFAVAQDAYLPALVAGDALVSANARLSASAAGAEMLAFATGGWLVQWLGPPHAIAIDAVAFLLSAACLAGITTSEPPPVGARESPRRRRAAGGWVGPWLGPAAGIGIGAVTFPLAAAWPAGIPTSEPPPGVARESAGLRHEAIAGVAVIARDPLLRAVSVADAATAFAFR